MTVWYEVETDAPFEAAYAIANETFARDTCPQQGGRLGVMFTVSPESAADELARALRGRGYMTWLELRATGA